MLPAIPVILALLLMVPTAGFAQDEEPEETGDVDMVIRDPELRGETVHGERVDRIFAPNISDFRVLDRKRLILYVTRFRPYLIVLRRAAPGLTYSSTIGLKRRSSNIDARFDSIYVNGFPHPIDYIEKLTPETAKRLLGLDTSEEEPEEPSEDATENPDEG